MHKFFFFIALGASIFISEAVQYRCDKVQQKSGSFNFPTNGGQNYTDGIDCTWNITVPSSYYLKVASTQPLAFCLNSIFNQRCNYNYQAEGTAQARSFVHYQLDGQFLMSISTSNFIFLDIIVSILPKPSSVNSTVLVPVGAPASLHDISYFLNSTTTFVSNTNYADAGIVLSVATKKEDPSPFIELKSCFVNYDGTTNPTTLYDFVGGYNGNDLNTLRNYKNLTVLCMETGDFEATVLAQEKNNLLGVSTYATYLLSSFSYVMTDDSTILTVVSPNGVGTTLVEFKADDPGTYLNVTDSSPQKGATASYNMWSGPQTFVSNLVSFISTNPHSISQRTVLFITASASKYGLPLLTLFITLLTAW